MIRLLLKYLANNEELVKRLSQSGPIREAARATASLLTKSKNFAEEHDLKNKIEPAKLKEMLQKFTQDVKSEIEEIKRRNQK